MKNTQPDEQWSFPFCPMPPAWALDWSALHGQFAWIRAMDGVPQSPVFHAEGNVMLHTRMVVEALVQLTEWQELSRDAQQMLFASALLHDVAKPICTKIAEDGHITSKGHAIKGELLARRLLWSGKDLVAPLPFTPREYIARLVRFHGLPLQFLDKTYPERYIFEASQSVRMDHVALLAETDVRGRVCSDQDELLERITLFRTFCQELDCYTAPRAFPDAHSRFVYFHSDHTDPDYQAYDTTTFEVVMLSGLPAAGKDTWLHKNLPDWPVVSLDTIRKELKISADEAQGQVVQAAKERAREHMRQQRSFVWNATNISQQLRQQLVDLFVSYGARVRIVYIDAPFATIVKRNRERAASVPEHVLYKLLQKLEVPTPVEAHDVVWISNP